MPEALFIGFITPSAQLWPPVQQTGLLHVARVSSGLVSNQQFWGPLNVLFVPSISSQNIILLRGKNQVLLRHMMKTPAVLLSMSHRKRGEQILPHLAQQTTSTLDPSASDPIPGYKYPLISLFLFFLCLSPSARLSSLLSHCPQQDRQLIRSRQNLPWFQPQLRLQPSPGHCSD